MTNEMQIFDRNLLRIGRDAAARSFARHDFIFKLVADYTMQRLVDMGMTYKAALDFGCHTGEFGKLLLQNNIVEQVVFSDLSAAMIEGPGLAGLKVIADEEYLPFAKDSFDLVISNMSLHWVNDLPGTLLQIYKCLKSKGMFIATIPGIETLKELRRCFMEAEMELTGGVTPQIAPFADVKSLGHLMQRAGFVRPVADSETLRVVYKDMFALLRDLKKTGQNNVLLKRGGPLGRKILQKAGEKYQQYYPSKEGGIVATIEIITITGLAG